MDAIFEHIGAKLDIPFGTKVYKLDDAATAFNFTPEQKQSCLLVLGDIKSDTITIVNHLGETEGEQEYKQLIEFSIEQTKSNGGQLASQDKTFATNGLELTTLKFTTFPNNVYVIFGLINNNVVMSSTSCNKQNFKLAQAFATKLMTSLCSTAV